MTKKVFEINAEAGGDNKKRIVTFVHKKSSTVIGKIPLQAPDGSRWVQTHPIDKAWHRLLKSPNFIIPSVIPYELQIALILCAGEYKEEKTREKLTYRFLQNQNNPCVWNLTQS